MLFSYLKTVLRRYFRPSVEDCLASISRVIAKLDESAQRNTEIASAERDYAAKLLCRAFVHDDEANRALRVQSKLLNLTS